MGSFTGDESIHRWQFWIDVGGTFTDCLARDPRGHVKHLKILSSGVTKFRGRRTGSNEVKVVGGSFAALPDHFYDHSEFRSLAKSSAGVSRVLQSRNSKSLIRLTDDVALPDGEFGFELDANLPSVILAIHDLTQIPLASPLPPCDVFLGTTKGTNALLTRTGSKTALVTSLGFRELLAIGDQTRPHLFELTIQKPEMLYDRSIEINERILFDGTVELAPDRDVIRDQLVELKSFGIDSVAVCLMHAYRYPRHEQIVGQIAKKIGFADVRISSEVAPLIKIVPRAQTTVLDAYLNPVLGNYLSEIERRIGKRSRLKLMTSAGSLAELGEFSGKDSVLSGPAAGAVGSARVAEQLGFKSSIGFDMGGTSTDVSRFDGEFEYEYESQKAGVSLVTPVISIETVAAGGGSICKFDGTRLIVGPASAGSNPGPACYGRGGPLTVTDVNCFLGRIDPEQFAFRLDFGAVEDRLRALRREIQSVGIEMTLTQIAQGILQIANHNMALAIENVSVKKGYDVREYPLVSFGGAAGQHCCAVADELGIETILIHPNCSILSAFGVQLCDQSIARAVTVLKPLTTDALLELQLWHFETAKELKECLNVSDRDLESDLIVELRYEGTQSGIEVITDLDLRVADLESQFNERHQKLFGYVQAERRLEIVKANTKISLPGNRLQPVASPVSRNEFTDDQHQTVSSESDEPNFRRIEWNELTEGDHISGAAMIVSDTTTVFVDPGWSAVVAKNRLLQLSKTQGATNQPPDLEDFSVVDPVKLEIFNRSFQSIATQMGDSLRKTSVSVNVKERLDYSCAVFCERGRLVANAPHIPVHLGAMSESVQATIADNPTIRNGDVFVTNDPFRGGSHLPDVTVITPVFVDEDCGKPSFWVASRSHHAEIGGMTPGSMPPDATCLEQEGVLIQNLKLVDAGKEQFNQLHSLLIGGKYPSRNPRENQDDIRAQIAANRTGVNAILAMRQRFGWSQIGAYMKHVCSAAETKAKQAIQKIKDGSYRFVDQMDDGARIQVHIRKFQDQLSIDFEGTSELHAGNLNANRSIVRSAVIYLLRCLVGEEIPLNDGLLHPISITLPHCFLNPDPSGSAATAPAVVGGNVETSQRIVDVLMGALELAGASQGTMNNWLIGDRTFGYYETVGGGSGATRFGPGADAVHCHMSNTRLTDPEILESRLPVILREFRIRSDSGGPGMHQGGNGIARRLEFRAPLTLSLLTSRRTCKPFGMAGGGPGAPGENWLIYSEGHREKLPGSCRKEVKDGDVLLLLTPGGGGFGFQSDSD